MATHGAHAQEPTSAPSLLHVHVSLKGRTVKTFTFSHDEVTIGRDPDADIFLDNVGVSREHARFERSPAGYVIADLGSANGTFLNDKPVQRHLINDDDIIQIGKYSLRVVEREDRRSGDSQAHQVLAPEAMQNTTVLTRDQVSKIRTASKVEEEEASESRAEPGPRPLLLRGPVLGALAGALLAGALAGAVVVFLAGR